MSNSNGNHGWLDPSFDHPTLLRSPSQLRTCARVCTRVRMPVHVGTFASLACLDKKQKHHELGIEIISNE